MDSKKQSKLPEGLGKKIIQALKTQGPTDQQTPMPNEMMVQGAPPDYQPSQQVPDEHGLETISHMDFGSQEMHYDEEPSPLEPTEFQPEPIPQEADLGLTSNASGAPQYGSFMGSTQESYEIADQSAFSEPNYNQQSYEQPMQEEFDYNQQSYDDFDTSFDPQLEQMEQAGDDIPDYQAPKLGGPSASNYELAPQQPQMIEAPEPAIDQDFAEYQPYEGQGYTEYTQEEANIPIESHEETYEDYSYQETAFSNDSHHDTYEETGYDQMQSYNDYNQPEIQVGYNQQDVLNQYQEEPHQSQWNTHQQIQETPENQDWDTHQQWEEPQQQASQRTIDLDAVQPATESQYTPPQPQTGAKIPLDLDQIDHQDHRPEPKREMHKYSEPVRPEIPLEERPYQEPPREVYRPEERYYNEPQRDSYKMEDRYNRQEEHHYQEPVREPYRSDDRYYNEPRRDYYRPEERHYHEQPRDHYRSDDRYYNEPRRDYYRPEERHYHEQPRDHYRPEEREPIPQVRDERTPPRQTDLFNSNVETLIRLVSTLPPGVTRQTGAQIIRQTMEAMGISMADVLSDAQNAQARLHKYTKDNFNRIEEYKLLVRQLDDDIQYYQRKSKELDDLINLFILCEQESRSR